MGKSFDLESESLLLEQSFISADSEHDFIDVS